MAATVVFQRRAADEYLHARDWYSARSPHVSERFTQAVNAAVAKVEASPEACATIAGRYRYTRVRGFPYFLVFRPRSSTVTVIVAVAHGRRRPGYWQQRR